MACLERDGYSVTDHPFWKKDEITTEHRRYLWDPAGLLGSLYSPINALWFQFIGGSSDIQWLEWRTAEDSELVGWPWWALLGGCWVLVGQVRRNLCQGT